MKYLLLACLFFMLLNNIGAQPVYPGKAIGSAEVRAKKTSLNFENKSLKAEWVIVDQVVRAHSFTNKETGQTIDWKDSGWFSLMLKNGEQLTSNDFVLTALPVVSSIKGQPKAIKESDQINGKRLTADLYSAKAGLTLRWEVSLKDASNYVQQKFTLITKDSLNVDKISLIELPDGNGVQSSGVVAGSPLTGNNFFFAIEHPMSQNETSGQLVSSFLKRFKPVTASAPLTLSAVWGVSPKQQMRRSFLYYLERERVVPYHQQLHYNSWYDISWIAGKLDETKCMDRIQTFADSLIVKRKTQMDAFLFDDGWDDNQSLWQFNNGFPNGFTKMAALAKKYNASLGVWISPWGGYEEAKAQRLEYGKKQNPPFETNANGFSLSGNVYYNRFFDVASNFVKKQGVTMFKFDGVGAGDGTEGVSASYEKDIDALLKLVSGLRGIKPDLYFNLTIGTWPSPYWLNYGDAIWRNGWDTGVTGVGSKRQQWINYRDAEAYKNIVKRGPLYPLNSLMYHGICIADHGTPETLEMSDKDIADEIWSFFATGTSLQELYVNPHKLSSANWDCLANAINWARGNEKTLADVHWVGGDPGKGEVYGWGAWSPEKSIISLRNPSSEAKTFHVSVKQLLELPSFVTKGHKFYSINSESKRINEFVSDSPEFEIVLQPFEVKILEGNPKK